MREVLHALDVKDRVLISGPELNITPNAAVSFALAIHELGTNAVKYGALGRAGGKVSVRWEIIGRAADRLRFTWEERSEAAISPPGRSGFGTALIQHALAVAMRGTFEQRLSAQGLTCVGEGPIAAIVH